MLLFTGKPAKVPSSASTLGCAESRKSAKVPANGILRQEEVVGGEGHLLRSKEEAHPRKGREGYGEKVKKRTCFQEKA